MSQISKVPTLTKMVRVLITIREFSLFLMLQIPSMPTITVTRMVHVSGHPHHRGEGKDLNDLTLLVTVVEGRQPTTLQNAFRKRNADNLGESTPTTPWWDTGKDLN